jgi:hypothetical protein
LLGYLRDSLCAISSFFCYLDSDLPYELLY